MNLTSKATIKDLLKRHGLWAKKSLGQNFLVDKDVLDKILEVANLSKNDLVLEIGPGLGGLTKELCKKAGRVITVEKDSKMVEILKETTKECNNLEIINDDILKIAKLKIENFKVVANLPYNITSPVIRKFLETDPKPSEMILMVQKEVAEKITAKPGEMSILAISVQFYAKPEMVQVVPASSFWPKPKVDSAIFRISRITHGLLMDNAQIKLFFRIVKAGFGERRKQLKNSLASGLWMDEQKVVNLLKKAGLDPKIRAQELSLADWIKIYEKINL